MTHSTTALGRVLPEADMPGNLNPVSLLALTVLVTAALGLTLAADGVPLASAIWLAWIGGAIATVTGLAVLA